MCWYVYIATSKPLRNVRFTRDNPPGPPPLLHFQEITDDPELRDNQCRPLFQQPHLYYVGSTSGCSCHLAHSGTTDWGDGTIQYDWYPSCAVFLDFIQRYTQYEPLEMYAVWEDDWDHGLAAQPSQYVAIDASTLTIETYFGLSSRCFYRFGAWGAPDAAAQYPQFLNVDLDVEAHADLQPLIDYWNDHLIALVQPSDTGTHFARFESVVQPEDAPEAIRLFCDAVEGLPADLAAFWQQCPVRRLDIGYDSGSEAPYHHTELPADLLARAAHYFTGIGIVLYPIE